LPRWGRPFSASSTFGSASATCGAKTLKKQKGYYIITGHITPGMEYSHDQGSAYWSIVMARFGLL